MHKIMVVDDEATITMQLEESMTSMGFQVVGSASSGQEALDMARVLRPDLILMDIVMPGRLDGIDASIKIKAELDIPIIFLTAYADDEFIMRAKNVEPFGYILKPFQEREIKASIEIALYKKELEKNLRASEEQLRTIVDSALKQAEEKLKTKEKELRHAARLSSLGEIAAGVAHEINQPLSVISMAAESTLRDIKKNLFDVRGLPCDLEDIMRNVGRIDRIIEHMRRFTRKSEEWRLVEPEETLNNVFILFGEQLKTHDISVYRKIEDNLPLIEVDVNQLEQIFVNILINAEQVLDDRGEEAKKSGEDFEKKLVCGISRKKENEHEWVMFEFADNAYGVPDELKRKIFEPFFTTKEAGEGTGLGLSITHDIVTRSLGGKILVEDNDMGGASFKVAVKVKKGPEVRSQMSEVGGRC